MLTGNTKIIPSTIFSQIKNELDQYGYKLAFTALAALTEIADEYEKYRKSGLLDETLSADYLSDFDYQLVQRHPNGTLVVVAIPQPQYRVSFIIAGENLSALIPPTYYHGADKRVRRILQNTLSRHGYSLFDMNVPKKLLAVRSGLASYGRNNLAYIAGLGSFFRLLVIGTDLPVSDANWQQPEMLERCQKCRACSQACPSNAITKDRFLIQAGRCLTRHNEMAGDFPDWIRPEWHHCLVGCMQCQWICPENTTHKNRQRQLLKFNAAESREILAGSSQNELSANTKKKLHRSCLLDYLEQLPRNLTALRNNRSQNTLSIEK